MYAIDVRQIQAPIKEEYRSHPERARIQDVVHSLPSDLSDPTRVRVGRAGPKGFEIAIGVHRGVGGDGTLPCSGDVLAAALAGCQELSVRMVAANMGVQLEDVRVEVSAGQRVAADEVLLRRPPREEEREHVLERRHEKRLYPGA